MFCPRCGKGVEEDAKFCGYCGYEFVMEKDTATIRARMQPSETAPTGALRILIYILSFCIPIIGIIIGIIYWVQQSEEAKVFGRNCVIIALIVPVLIILSAIIAAFIFGMGGV